jgi:hypothetical protein
VLDEKWLQQQIVPWRCDMDLKTLIADSTGADAAEACARLSATADAVEAMKRVPWTTLAELKGDPEILQKLDDAEALLKSLRKTLSL